MSSLLVQMLELLSRKTGEYKEQENLHFFHISIDSKPFINEPSYPSTKVSATRFRGKWNCKSPTICGRCYHSCPEGEIDESHALHIPPRYPGPLPATELESILPHGSI